MEPRDRDLASAFDGQAAAFERAPLQTDATALASLVAFADLAPDSRVLDAGCGPGLVARALLEAGHDVFGVDLSGEMVRRARERCAGFGVRARFEQRSVFDLDGVGPFDAAVSRFVLHHVADPPAFLRRQVVLVRAGGAVVASDHTTDPDGAAAAWHQDLERARDRTHVRNLAPGELVDLLAAAGLERIQLVEEPFALDFDEWFDRGTPDAPKEEVRSRLLAGRARGFEPEPLPGGAVRIRCVRALARGVNPA